MTFAALRYIMIIGRQTSLNSKRNFMKILVTGNNGSLGRTLTTLFDSKGIKWVGTDGYDLTEPMEVKELFEKNMDISIVVHLAAVQNSDPDVFQKNLAMMENVLRYNKGKARIIFASTNVVYGNICVDRAKINQDTRFGDNKTSELATEKDITIPTSKYGASKLACENLLRIANLTDHIDYTILRFCAIVGPNTRFGAFKDLYEKVKGNKTVRAFGYGPGSTKNFLHVDDAANCVLSAIRNLDKFSEKTFNVAGENAVSI